MGSEDTMEGVDRKMESPEFINPTGYGARVRFGGCAVLISWLLPS
jgi:hypothetical protein